MLTASLDATLSAALNAVGAGHCTEMTEKTMVSNAEFNVLTISVVVFVELLEAPCCSSAKSLSVSCREPQRCHADPWERGCGLLGLSESDGGEYPALETTAPRWGGGVKLCPAWALWKGKVPLQMRGENSLTQKAKSIEMGASLSLEHWRALNPLSSTGSLAL